MSRNLNNWLYVGVAIVIILILYWIFKSRRRAIPVIAMNEGGKKIIVKTPKGIIYLDYLSLVAELEQINLFIAAHREAAHNEKIYLFSLKRAVDMLDNFINVNTITRAYSNKEILLGSKMGEIELANKIAFGELLQGNVLNNPMRDFDGENDSESVDFVYDQDLSLVNKMARVNEKLNIVIRLIKQQAFTHGEVDLRDLYALQDKMRAEIGCGQKCNCLGGMCINPDNAVVNYTSNQHVLNEVNKDVNYYADRGEKKYKNVPIKKLTKNQVEMLNSTSGENWPGENSRTRVSSDVNIGPVPFRKGGDTLYNAYTGTMNADLNSNMNKVPYKDKEDVPLHLKKQIDNMLGLNKIEGMISREDDDKNIDQNPGNCEAMSGRKKTDYLEFSDKNENLDIEAQQNYINAKDHINLNNKWEVQFGDTWDAFIRSNPSGWLSRNDIQPADFLGYRLTGDFQRSLYNFTDSYSQKVTRCLQDKYKNLEDGSIFDRCMGWY